jgi:threonine/homoserine/homoserine lactone efflux protein
MEMKRLGFAFDLAAVLVFVGIGRSTHDHGMSLGGVSSTLWPFAVALALGWLVEFARHRDPTRIDPGMLITVVTVAIGMALRVLAGQGTAVAFVFVALGFLGAAMLAWRVIARFTSSRRSGNLAQARPPRPIS